MISTKNFITDQNNINSAWVFEYYLDLPEHLSGQDLKIKSIFNPNEKTPSMCIYLCPYKNEYKFKDFSTGKQGSKIDLVQLLFNLNYSKALFRIIEDHNKWIVNGGTFYNKEFISVPKYKLDYIKERDWSNSDINYWLQYNITIPILTEYHVFPIEYFTMIKDHGNEIEKIKIEKKNTYGYYSKEGQCYKIYQPLSTKNKFTKIEEHLQGLEQLTYLKDYLIIVSSLKDGMCLKSFDFNIEFIAPHSENTIIKPHIIHNLKSKYKKVLCLFDNDEAGHNAMKIYEKLYDIEGIYIKSEKDISDAVKKYSAELVKPKLLKLIKEKI
jgi:5S rRNA maturation endonuclease (ribonuclease M5)